MLKNTRVSGTMDTARLGASLARPGMDPRVWITIANIDALGFDKDHGMFADITVMPTGEQETVRVGTAYAGNGFGIYAPLEVDDEVLVAFPSGEPDHGGWIIGRAWSAADKPPSEVGDNTDDLHIHIKKDKNLRLIVEGGGNIILQVADGKVLLGGDSDTHPVAFADKVQEWLDEIKSQFNGHKHVETGGTTDAVLPPMQIFGIKPAPEIKAEKTEAK